MADNKWIEAIYKMLKLTKDGDLQWKVAKPPSSLSNGNEILIDTIFTTEFKNKLIRLYEKRTKITNSENSNWPHLLKGSFWSNEIVLEFIDEEGHSLWRFPQSSALDDLLNSVKYQVAGVTDFLDEILETQ